MEKRNHDNHHDEPKHKHFPLIDGLLTIYNKVKNLFTLAKDTLNVLIAFKDEALRHLHEILKFISQINHRLHEIERRLDALEGTPSQDDADLAAAAREAKPIVDEVADDLNQFTPNQ